MIINLIAALVGDCIIGIFMLGFVKAFPLSSRWTKFGRSIHPGLVIWVVLVCVTIAYVVVVS